MLKNTPKVLIIFLLFLLVSVIILIVVKPNPFWQCEPIFEVSSGSELTASQVYSSKCYKQTSENECKIVDIFRQSTNNFGNEDGIPDCEWKFVLFQNI